jgi:hypothetical protein
MLHLRGYDRQTGAGGGEPAARFGLALVPAREDLGRFRELARAADETGLDLVGIQDRTIPAAPTLGLSPSRASCQRSRSCQMARRSSRPSSRHCSVS